LAWAALEGDGGRGAMDVRLCDYEYKYKTKDRNACDVSSWEFMDILVRFRLGTGIWSSGHEFWALDR